MLFQMCHVSYVFCQYRWCACVPCGLCWCVEYQFECFCVSVSDSKTIKTGAHCCQGWDGWDVTSIHELFLALSCHSCFLASSQSFIIDFMCNYCTFTLFKESSQTQVNRPPHTHILPVCMWKFTHDSVCRYFVWVPCSASRGLYVTTNPGGTDDRCVWLLSGCKAPACSERLSVNGGSHHNH